ncbi:carbon starvation CstA family protein [Paludifilum halophilum]|uniref:Carbon starvation protein A n=1 Tax=Paludifilum halophilum TaxID=1642702 RepID=A0A235B3J8_9BACL|nr:carbon starvation protein A [Paludifilum halophilum]OYD06539.1 carbon starvation protein A [Paludifilum halophilum]
MSAVILAFLGFIAFFLGYRFYSKWIAEKVYCLDPDFVTPAHRYRDGVDYVPTPKQVLWGHHFSSVAGAAPILGPAIAVFWGWLPALLWVILGTVFIAGVHDFGSIVIANRHRGQSMGSLARNIIGPRAKTLFLLIILFLVIMVNAVFAWAIANLFINFPGSVLPIFVEIPLAAAIGYMVYRRKGGLFLPSIVGLAVLYGFVLVGYYVPVDVSGWTVAGLEINPFVFWILILMAYGLIASVLPVWLLLQPRDYINSHQLFLGLFILYAGMFVINPDVVAPAVNSGVPADSPPWFPILFITVACGAISGFHGLIGSGTTSKQLDKETDARYIGYFGAVGEGALALLSIIACVAAFSTLGEWQAHYADFAKAGEGALPAFVKGAALFAGGLGIPKGIAEVFVAVIVISFAATSLDTSIRLMRYIISELGESYRFQVLTRKPIAAAVGTGVSLLLIFSQEDGRGGYLIWPLFGTTNQLVGGLTLLVLSIWLWRLSRNMVYTLIPMIFLLSMTSWAMLMNLKSYYLTEQYLLLFLGLLLLCFVIWLILEAIFIFRKGKGALRRSESEISEFNRS